MLEDLMRQIRNRLYQKKEGGVDPEIISKPQHQQQLGIEKTIVSSHLVEKVQEVGRTHDTFSSGSASLSTSWSKAWFNSLKVRLVGFFGNSQVRWNADTARVIGMLLNALDRVDDSLIIIRQELEGFERKSTRFAQRSDRPSLEQGQKEAERQSTALAHRLKLVEAYCWDMEQRLKRLEQVQQKTVTVLDLQPEKLQDPTNDNRPT